MMPRLAPLCLCCLMHVLADAGGCYAVGIPPEGALPMIDLFYWPTPNGQKVALFLEEAQLEYTAHPVNIGKGEQHQPAFLKISPNNRIPAIVDHAPVGGGAPLSVFESGAILMYLAEKVGKFLPVDLRGRVAALEWLFWQVGGLGPMAGQNHHFNNYAPQPIPYAIDRYVKEAARLYGVLDRRLADHRFLAGDSYSIADMASYPWVVPHEMQQQNLGDFPSLRRWFEEIAVRPATQRAYERGEKINPPNQTLDDEARKHLFGQGQKD